MAIKLFSDTLRELRAGRTLDELSEELNRLVGEVRKTGKSGKLLLTIEVKPASKGDIDTVIVTDDIKTKIPKLDRGGTLFFPTNENNLQRNDPRQKELGLRAVEDPAKDAKQAK